MQRETLKENEVRSLVKDKNEHMRIWAMKLMVDEGKASEKASETILEHAQKEKSPLVRLHLASIMRNLSDHDRWKLAETSFHFRGFERRSRFSVDGLVWNRATNQGRSGQSTAVGEEEQIDYSYGMDSEKTCRIVILPDDGNGVFLHFLVSGHKIEVFRNNRGYKDPIDWIVMMVRDLG